MNKIDIENLLNKELSEFSNKHLQKEFEKFLVKPYIKLLWWQWEKPISDFPCWVIADLQIRQVGVAYSKHGFGKTGYIWGLTFLTEDSSFGADNNWYKTLEELVIDSGYWDKEGEWKY